MTIQYCSVLASIVQKHVDKCSERQFVVKKGLEKLAQARFKLEHSACMEGHACMDSSIILYYSCGFCVSWGHFYS